MSQIDLSLIIPCYNEELILESSMRQVFEMLDNSRFSYEIVFVDDCSRDSTRKIIESIISKNLDRKIKKIFHAMNKGRGQAVSDGIRAAEGGVVGFIDIDLEVHARYIPSCVLAVKSGYDVVTAQRIYKFQPKFINRHLMSRGYSFLVRKLLGVRLKDTETGFKFFNHIKILTILDEIKEGGWFWDTEVMVRAYLKGYRIEEIPCLYLRNIDKSSTVNSISDSIYYFKKLLNFRHEIKMQSASRSIKDYWLKSPYGFSHSYNQKGNALVSRFLRGRFTHIFESLDIKKSIKAIDVGCGTGVYMKMLLEKGAEVTGVDFSDKMLETCGEYLKGLEGKGYTLINCEAHLLNVPDNKFDLLISVGLLDYVEDVKLVIREFSRIIRSGGEILFTVPKKHSPFFLLRSKPGNYIKDKIFHLPPIKNTFSEEEIRRFLLESRLKLEKIESFYKTMWIIKCKKYHLNDKS